MEGGSPGGAAERWGAGTAAGLVGGDKPLLRARTSEDGIPKLLVSLSARWGLPKQGEMAPVLGELREAGTSGVG